MGKDRSVAEVVAYLQTLPQDFIVMENSGYYIYEWSPMTELSFAEVNDAERRVYFTNTGA